MRRFLGCVSGAGGRTCRSEASRQGWRGVLAEHTPPLRAAVKRRRGGQAESDDARERRSLRSPSGRLRAKRCASLIGLRELAEGCYQIGSDAKVHLVD